MTDPYSGPRKRVASGFPRARRCGGAGCIDAPRHRRSARLVRRVADRPGRCSGWERSATASYLWHPVVMGAVKPLLQHFGVFTAAGATFATAFRDRHAADLAGDGALQPDLDRGAADPCAPQGRPARRRRQGPDHPHRSATNRRWWRHERGWHTSGSIRGCGRRGSIGRPPGQPGLRPCRPDRVHLPAAVLHLRRGGAGVFLPAHLHRAGRMDAGQRSGGISYSSLALFAAFTATALASSFIRHQQRGFPNRRLQPALAGRLAAALCRADDPAQRTVRRHSHVRDLRLLRQAVRGAGHRPIFPAVRRLPFLFFFVAFRSSARS